MKKIVIMVFLLLLSIVVSADDTRGYNGPKPYQTGFDSSHQNGYPATPSSELYDEEALKIATGMYLGKDVGEELTINKGNQNIAAKLVSQFSKDVYLDANLDQRCFSSSEFPATLEGTMYLQGLLDGTNFDFSSNDLTPYPKQIAIEFEYETDGQKKVCLYVKVE